MNKNEDYKELANNLTDEVVDLRIENEKLKKANKELTEQLRLYIVSQQRELLLAFAKHQRDWGNTPLSKEMHEKEVEHFLKANNCG